MMNEFVPCQLWCDRSKTKNKVSTGVVIISLIVHKITLAFWLDFLFTNNQIDYVMQEIFSLTYNLILMGIMFDLTAKSS